MINKTLLAETLKNLELDFTEMPVEEGEDFFTLKADFDSFSVWFFLQDTDPTLAIHALFKWQPEFNKNPEKLLTIINGLNFNRFTSGHLEVNFSAEILRYVTYRSDSSQLDINLTQKQTIHQIMLSGFLSEVFAKYSQFPEDPFKAAAAFEAEYTQEMKSFFEEAAKKISAAKSSAGA